MKVLSIIDSFKGTITSKQLNKIVKEELEKKGHTVDCITIADGGDGFCEAIADILENVKYLVYSKIYDPYYYNSMYLIRYREGYLEGLAPFIIGINSNSYVTIQYTKTTD